jgi:hypothetical protein
LTRQPSTAYRLTRQPRQAVVPGLPGAALLVRACQPLTKQPASNLPDSSTALRTAFRLTRQPRHAVVPGLPGAAQLTWACRLTRQPSTALRSAYRLTRQPRQAVVPGHPGAAQLWVTPSDLWSAKVATGIRHGSSTEFGSIARSAAAAAYRLTRQPRQAVVPGHPGAAQLWVTPSDLWSAQVATGIRHGSSTKCRLTGSTAPLSICFERNVKVARGTKERNVTRSSNNCCSLCGILQKTGRVRVDLNSEHREGSVAMPSEAV